MGKPMEKEFGARKLLSSNLEISSLGQTWTESESDQKQAKRLRKGKAQCLRSIQSWFRDRVSCSDTYIGSGVTFRHIYWIGCHVPTHILDRVSRSDTYIGSGVTFRHIYWIGCHVPTHILDRVSRSDTYIGPGVTFRHMYIGSDVTFRHMYI
uniref:Uncharacterized protein n=1 Tax=Solanum tuberosum TaxID=4113 RepID=M1DRC0_SOLTU